MNFGFTEEQELLRSTTREFLEQQCPMPRVRELSEQTETAYDPVLWKQMAELGWLGLLLPEAYGGSGLSYVELVVVLEEMGRTLVPSPLLGHLLGTQAVLEAGSDDEKKELLGGAVTGDHLLSFAITEEAGTEKPEDLALRAEKDGEGYRLTGTKLFVPDAAVADTLIVLARTGEGPEALSLLRVPAGADGVRITALKSMDLTRRLYEVCFEGTPATLLGAENEGGSAWERIRDVGILSLSAEAIGGSEKTLEDSVKYAKERVQFGKPIGVNQAIKHKCADMLIRLESARSVLYYAAWALSEGEPEARSACAMAKSYACDAYRENSAENIQIHGGVGFTWEYDCHLYFKRAKALEVLLGSPAAHRERVVQLMNL